MKLHAKIQSVCLVVLSYCTIIARSRMETIPLPRPLESCLQEKNWYRPTLTDEEAIGSCLVDYMWNNNRKCKSVSKDTVTWFGELAVNRSNHLRLNPIPKERKEYRVLSDDERNDYHKAVNLLKNNKEKHPNKYDAFVDFHRGIAGMAAHRGPAFLGWHRYFIFLYEQALQEEMPGVMLPYWDSTLDTEMSNPTDSVIWTNLFAGNGNGSVRTGPFSNWVASNGQRLTRAIGQGQLMDKQKVLDTLVNHAHHNTFGRDIESQHDSVHLWVGGHMSDIEVAPSDPMFFLHHAYIDCIWEQFRKRFRQPEDDYPNVRGIHAADKYMANLPKFPDDRSSRFGGNLLKNKDGYRNFWTERYYRCAPPPECSFRKPDCGSKWLECNVFTQRCVSKKSSAALPKITPEQMMKVMYQCYPDRKPANKAASETSIDTPTISYDMISEGESFYTYVIETQKTSSVHERKKRASIRNFSGFIQEVQTQRKHVAPTKQVQRQNDRNSFIAPPNAQIQIQWEKEVKNEPSHSKSDRLIQVQVKREPDEEVDLSTMSIDKFYIPEIDKPCDGYPIQNLFTADCKSDINLWVFVAVKVVHIRHGDVSYTTYEKMEGDGNFKEQDIYTEGEWIEFFNGRPLQKRPSIKKCHNDKSGLVKIRISSYGLNYDGTFSDNVFVDNRQPVTEAISFIAIKKPEMSSIEVLLTAVDQCGIACRAYCLPSKKQGQKPTYKECSGSIKFSAGSPNMYHKTYLDAAKNVWSESSSGILFSNENEIPIIFYCDYKDHRPTKLFGTTEG